MKKRMLSLLLAVSMALSLTACAEKSAPAPEAPAASAPAQAAPGAERVSFTDDCGRMVEVPAEISRIVPSGPLAQIILFALAPDLVVGLGDEWNDSAKGFIAQEYLDLPYLGQLYGSADLNVEELARQDPQLIIDMGIAKASVAEDMDKLQSQTNIPAVFVSASLETMPQTFRTLGALLGKEEKGEQLARFCEKTYSRTLSILEQVGENKADALYITGQNGLNVLAKDSYHAELIDLLTNNIAVVDNPISKGTGNEVSMEQLMTWDPEFIIFAPDSMYEKAAQDPTWGHLTAIARGNYVEAPDGPHNWMGMPPAVQRYLSLIWLPYVLYPQYCDYDVQGEIEEYYRLFYGCELTQGQYEALTANAFLR